MQATVEVLQADIHVACAVAVHVYLEQVVAWTEVQHVRGSLTAADEASAIVDILQAPSGERHAGEVKAVVGGIEAMDGIRSTGGGICGAGETEVIVAGAGVDLVSPRSRRDRRRVPRRVGSDRDPVEVCGKIDGFGIG